MKKHNTLKVVLVTALVFLVLSWIIPAAYFSSEFIDQGRVQMGLFDFFEYPLTAISYFGYVPAFLLFVGGFYGVLYKIPAYRNFLDKVAAKCKAHSKLAISLVIILLALGVSVCGLQLAFALVVPFLVSLLVLMGYDKKTVAYVIVGAMIAGLVGSTYAVQNVGLAINLLALKFDYQITVRFVLLAAVTLLVILNVLLSIRKQEKVAVTEIKLDSNKKEEKDEEVVVEKEEKPVKKEANKSASKKTTTTKGAGKNTKGKSSSSKGKSSSSTRTRKNANKAALKDEEVIVAKNECSCCNCLVPEEVEGKNKTWPFIVLFFLLVLVMVVAFMPWGETGFNVSFFTKVVEKIQKYELFGFPIFAKVLGTIEPFGNWSVNQLILPASLVLLLLMFIYKVKFNDALDGFVSGVKKAVVPALVGVAMYSILVIVTYHPFQLTLYKVILGLTEGFNIATTTLVTVLASLFNSDPIYTAQSYLPYYVSVITNADNYSLVAVIYQAMYGLTMLIAPTSLVLMCTLSYLKVNYLDWLKTIWKLLLELFVILLIVFIILALV